MEQSEKRNIHYKKQSFQLVFSHYFMNAEFYLIFAKKVITYTHFISMGRVERCWIHSNPLLENVRKKNSYSIYFVNVSECERMWNQQHLVWCFVVTNKKNFIRFYQTVDLLYFVFDTWQHSKHFWPLQKHPEYIYLLRLRNRSICFPFFFCSPWSNRCYNRNRFSTIETIRREFLRLKSK